MSENDGTPARLMGDLPGEGSEQKAADEHPETAAAPGKGRCR
jgi:hypothetical protein